jgi:precorrin-2 C20-methyltransferase/precorrin-3B C17-methyltransferase
VTTGETDHPGGYEGAISEFYDACAAELAAHLQAGRDVAVLCEGDPFLYGSYMYLHDRLAGRYEAEVIPGVTSFSAAAAAAGTPLVRRDDVLTILPGTLAPDELAARLRASDAAVVMKLGRTFPAVRGAAGAAGVLERGIYVERASSDEEVVAPLTEVDGTVPYMSLVLIPALPFEPTRPAPRQTAGVSDKNGDSLRHRGGESPNFFPERGGNGDAGVVSVIGLGPAGPDWLTPEARAELAAAEHLIGYETYLNRVPERRGQIRHATDNGVELERARRALRLAADGARVAVVSSGDPGIFAMAAAVLEAVEEVGAAAAPEIRVVPGLSAMQAAAARVGAPLGHDFCVLSLSDQLKPWEVIERRLDAAGAADLVLALYNPASKTRREQLSRAIDVLRRHRSTDTPVVVARAVGDPDAERIDVTTLGEIELERVDMRTLLIVGSSTTRIVGDRVYTPRRYPA